MTQRPSSRRAGEPGRRPASVPRDGQPRKELAHWLRQWLEAHGDPTIDDLVRALPDEARLSSSALGKALKGETFVSEPALSAILRMRGATDEEVRSWSAYRSYLDYLDYYRSDDPGKAKAPKWQKELPAGSTANDERGQSTDEKDDDGSPRRLRRPRRVTSAVLGVLIGIGLTAAAVVFFHSFESPVSNPSAVIIEPGTTMVPNTFQLAGSYQDLPSGTLLWVATFDPAKNLFFPQDKPCVALPNNTFNCGQYYVGDQHRPDNASYVLVVATADASASNSLLQYQIDKGGPTGNDPGLKSLPQGTQVILSRDVVRVP